jgi:hypothetical protein
LPPDGPRDSGRRHSDPSPQGHRSSRCSSLGSAAPGGYCHTPCVEDQNSKTRGGLSLTHTTLDGVGPDLVYKRRIPVFLAGDLNAKHTDWNSRLTTAKGLLLRDYANRNSFLIYGPDSPTMAPYTHNATPDVIDIVVVKDFVLPVHVCLYCTQLESPASSDRHHMPIILSKPTGPPRLHANGLGCFPGLHSRQTSGESRFETTRRQSTTVSRG